MLEETNDKKSAYSVVNEPSHLAFFVGYVFSQCFRREWKGGDVRVEAQKKISTRLFLCVRGCLSP